MPKFQHRHYETVAAILAEAKPWSSGPPSPEVTAGLAVWGDIVGRLSVAFTLDNPRFDTSRFLYACNDKHIPKIKVVVEAVEA